MEHEPVIVLDVNRPSGLAQTVRRWRNVRQKRTGDSVTLKHRLELSRALAVQMLLEKFQRKRVLAIVDENWHTRCEPNQVPAIVEPVVQRAGIRLDRRDHGRRHWPPLQA